MQSRTSFFNRSIFRKSVGRFWPIWGAYFAVWFILAPVVLLANRYDRSLNAVRDFLLNVGFVGGLITSAVFAVFSAMAVWSFLYNTRAAHGMACLPVRREGVFCSVVLAGALPYLAVNVVIAVLALLAQLAIGIADVGATVQMFCLITLPFLLFYGFATLCAQLTGNILVLPAVYAVLNFVFVGAELLARYLAGIFVYGMNQDMDAFSLKWLSPFVAILMRCRVTSHSVWNGTYYTYDGSYFQGWRVLIIYAVIGLVLLIPALLLYRRRRMETAGDVVAIEVLKPVFRWCMGLCGGLCLAALICVLFWENGRAYEVGSAAALVSVLVTLVLGAVIGWIAAEMLIARSFKVFRSVRWGGLGLCCVILAALLCACEFDLFGYEKYVPDPEKVQVVTLWCQGNFSELEAQESIQTVTALHESVVENKRYHEAAAEVLYGPYDPESTTSGVTMTLNYNLRSGRNVARRYTVYYDRAAGNYGDAELLQAALNCPEAIADRKATAFPITAENIDDSSITSVMTAADCAEAAGYASAEEYILREYCGLTGSELDGLSEAMRKELLFSAITSYAVNGDILAKEFDERVYMMSSASDLPLATVEAVEVRDLSLSDVGRYCFRYEWHFTPAQMMELYETCVLPDIADNTLGRIWIIEDAEYRNTVYSAEIRISAREALDRPLMSEMVDGGEQYVSFRTTPTVDSARTNAWLSAHGVELRTLAELEIIG